MTNTYVPGVSGEKEYTYEQVSRILLGMISDKFISFYNNKKRDPDFCETLLNEIRTWLIEKEKFFNVEVMR